MYTYLSSNQNRNSATMNDIKLVAKQVFQAQHHHERSRFCAKIPHSKHNKSPISPKIILSASLAGHCSNLQNGRPESRLT